MMPQKTIGIRELKGQLSSHIKEVREGGTLVITDRGKPVARLVPVAAGLAEKVQTMLDSGMASWSGQKPSSDLPRVPVRGLKTLAELLLEDRE
jgi:prevent-host-death family protein